MKKLSSLMDLLKTDTPSKFHFVFDLDSTIFDVTPRTQAIFNDFCTVNSDARLKRVQFLHSDWGLKTAFARGGIDITDSTFLKFHSFWHRRFFSSEYLEFDELYPAASDYVKTLEKLGAKISYLTGRDAEHMLEGTVKSLQKHQLPLLADAANLIMKPKKAWGEDEDFKVRMLLPLQNKEKVIFFENEPMIINKVAESAKDIFIVFTNTVHSGRAKPDENIYALPSWLIELENLSSCFKDLLPAR